MFYLFGSIIFLLLFVVLLILIIGVNLLARFVGGLKNLWHLVTGKGYTVNSGRQNSQNRTTYYTNDTQGQYSESEDQGHRPHSKGVFGDDEGTYVDFEEVK